MEQKKHKQEEWWKTLFDQKYLDTYLSRLTLERTAQEIDFVVKVASLKPSDKILDLACGHGRHSIELSKRGFNVTGLDYSEPFLKKAKKDAKKAEINAEFIRGDMKDLPFDQDFDVILMLFTSFGYFDDKGNQKTLSEVSKGLKPGGRFLIDVINGEAVIDRFNKEGQKEDGSDLLKIPRTFEAGGLTIDEIEWYDPDKQQVHNHREWVGKDGAKKEYDYYLKTYVVEQYKDMLSEVGLEFKQIWGDFQENPHNTDGNSRTIILAQKSSD